MFWINRESHKGSKYNQKLKVFVFLQKNTYCISLLAILGIFYRYVNSIYRSFFYFCRYNNINVMIENGSKIRWGAHSQNNRTDSRSMSDEKNPVLLYFIFTRWPLQDQFYLRNANATSHQEEKKKKNKTMSHSHKALLAWTNSNIDNK